MKWPIVRLGDEVTIKGGGIPSRSKSEFYRGDIPWATIKDLIGLTLEHTQEHITKEALESSAANLIPPGNVILATRVGLGKVALNTVEVAINQDLKALFCSPRLDAKYLVYYLTSLSGSIEQQGVGATVKGITLKQIENWPLPLPPLPEQRRVVELLDQADALRKKHDEADAKANRILSALFYKIFGDAATNPKGWDKAPLEKLLRQNNGALQSGPFGTHLHNSDFVEEGTVLAVGIDNVHDSGFQIGRHRRITHEKFQQLKKYKLEPGDILITIMGTIGRTCVFPEWAGEAICTKYVYRIQIDRSRLESEYLCASFRFSPAVRAQLGASVTGQIVDGITSKEPKEFILDVPPLSLQRLFSQTKALLDRDAAKRAESKQQLDHLFSVLLQRAFSGALTAKWRETHMQELLTEMREQAKILQAKDVPDPDRQLSLYL